MTTQSQDNTPTMIARSRSNSMAKEKAPKPEYELHAKEIRKAANEITTAFETESIDIKHAALRQRAHARLTIVWEMVTNEIKKIQAAG